jgi:hypothetical protein
MLNPEAFYDSLTIVRELAPSLGGVSRYEVQRTAYLSCLLALYRSRPLAEWGYRFARTDFGTPYAAGINDALEFFIKSNWLTEDLSRLHVNSDHTGFFHLEINIFMPLVAVYSLCRARFSAKV